MTNKQLQHLCAEWQRRLRLEDWTIECSFAPQGEIAGDAVTNYNTQNARARVRLCTEETHSSAVGEKYDPELFLVHELMHIRMIPADCAWGVEAVQLLKDAYERAIDQTAYALVRAKRGEK